MEIKSELDLGNLGFHGFLLCDRPLLVHCSSGHSQGSLSPQVTGERVVQVLDVLFLLW